MIVCNRTALCFSKTFVHRSFITKWCDPLLQSSWWDFLGHYSSRQEKAFPPIICMQVGLLCVFTTNSHKSKVCMYIVSSMHHTSEHNCRSDVCFFFHGFWGFSSKELDNRKPNDIAERIISMIYTHWLWLSFLSKTWVQKPNIVKYLFKVIGV